MIATDKFAELARQTAAQSGLADARIAVVVHPIGGASKADLARRAEAVTEEVIALLLG